jgi:phospholipid/cholesterol/gamma-HCH transport system substrate-binding protein
VTRTLQLVAVLVSLVMLATACGLENAANGPTRVEAVVPRSNNLFIGSDVRVLGMTVGRVDNLEAEGANVRVTMEVDPEIDLPADATLEVIPDSLLGERFAQIDPPYTDGPTFEDGDTIPIERTKVPAETDEFLAAFEEFLSALDPDAVAELVDVLTETLIGQGGELNTLLDQGSDTVRILADSSDDLMAIIDELGDLNETVATRDQQIGQVLEDWSTVTRTISEESDEIIEGVDNLRRLTAELRPLLDDHADPLVQDLETLATSASTIDRNLERLADAARGGRELFAGAGRGVEFENARLAFDNRFEGLVLAIEERLANRLAGLCIRLGADQCASAEYWRETLPSTCIEGVTMCGPDDEPFEESLTSALGVLTEEQRAQLEADAAQQAAEEAERERAEQEAREREEAEAQAEADDDPIAPPTPGGDGEGGDAQERLPMPDPRLNSSDDEEDEESRSSSWRDRMSRAFGGGS